MPACLSEPMRGILAVPSGQIQPRNYRWETASVLCRSGRTSPSVLGAYPK